MVRSSMSFPHPPKTLADPSFPLAEKRESDPRFSATNIGARLPSVGQGSILLSGGREDDKNHVRYAVVASRFNEEIVDLLVEGALRVFKTHAISRRRIDVLKVPGAFELPVKVLHLAQTKRYRAIVAVGCILEGQTPQFQFLSESVYHGLITASLLTGVPVTSGVVTTRKYSHAKARAQKQGLNRGEEAARAALELTHEK